MNSKSSSSSPSETGIDPTYGYDLESLLTVPSPEPPEGFRNRWQQWYENALRVDPRPQVKDSGKSVDGWRIYDVRYHTTDDIALGGWLLLPMTGEIKRGFIVGHGYGGRETPDFHLPFHDSILFFPCARGLPDRSRTKLISSESHWHVLHNIQDPERYVLRGCAEDLWLAVSSLLHLYPELKGHLGYLGISFGGGVGALALSQEKRIERGHLNVPSFGNQALRLELPSHGSAGSVQIFSKKHPGVALNTLRWFDAATAARNIEIPIHCACAVADAFVAPPGQFAIYNSLGGRKELFVLDGGHMNYPDKEKQETELLQDLNLFFDDM